MTDTPDMMPCPFCTGPASVRMNTWADKSVKGYRVICSECHCGGAIRVIEAEAISVWNRRPQPQKDDAPAECQHCENGIIFHQGGYTNTGGDYVDGWEEPCPFCKPATPPKDDAPADRAAIVEECAIKLQGLADLYGAYAEREHDDLRKKKLMLDRQTTVLEDIRLIRALKGGSA